MPRHLSTARAADDQPCGLAAEVERKFNALDIIQVSPTDMTAHLYITTDTSSAKWTLDMVNVKIESQGECHHLRSTLLLYIHKNTLPR